MVILTGMKSSVFLWEEEKWGSLRGLRGDDTTGLEVFFNECFMDILFSRVEWVNLGNLGNKGVLEVDGMIKGTVGRKLFISLLGEDIGEVSTELGNGDFLRFLSLSDLHGDSKFVQLFINRSV